MHIPYATIVVADPHRARGLLLAVVSFRSRAIRHWSNPDAARLVGIRTGWRVFDTFGVSGAYRGRAKCCGPRTSDLDSTAGSGYELQVIAAVVVGGVAIFGGSGTVIGAALGALLLETINTALVRARHLVLLGQRRSRVSCSRAPIASITRSPCVSRPARRTEEQPLAPENRVAGSSGDDLEQPVAADRSGWLHCSRLNAHRGCDGRAGSLLAPDRRGHLRDRRVAEFLSSYNLFSLGLSNGEVAIMALPMTLIIITGEIDLSVAADLGLSSSMAATSGPTDGRCRAYRHRARPGLVLGAFNGVLVDPPRSAFAGGDDRDAHSLRRHRGDRSSARHHLDFPSSLPTSASTPFPTRTFPSRPCCS